jgi:hypothetical protein
MNFLLDVLIFFKRKNFTVLREFDVGHFRVKEYSYGSNTYLTDVWPPAIGTGSPINQAIFGEEDVTKQVLKFSGPMKNHINALAIYKKKRRVMFRFVRGGVRFSLEEFWEPRYGTVTVTDVLGSVKKETLSNTNGDPNILARQVRFDGDATG